MLPADGYGSGPDCGPGRYFTRGTGQPEKDLEKTSTSKFAGPSPAMVTWNNGRTDTLHVKHVNSDQGRDVVHTPEAPYVLKMQEASWYDGSNDLRPHRSSAPLA